MQVNIYKENWFEEIENKIVSHLICTGRNEDLQWFGTQLIQKLNTENTETSPIYGKLALSFDDFCYQLCHATPWGFEMGRNMNAVVDVIRGENQQKQKVFIIYDAHEMYLSDFKLFKDIFSVFLDVSKEQNLKIILLLAEKENVSVRKLLRRTEQFDIEVLEITQEV